jgi:hypothetical protein
MLASATLEHQTINATAFDTEKQVQHSNPAFQASNGTRIQA